MIRMLKRGRGTIWSQHGSVPNYRNSTTAEKVNGVLAEIFTGVTLLVE